MASASGTERTVALPRYKDAPGKCPGCGMDLIPQEKPLANLPGSEHVMISKKLQQILVLAIPLFIVHGLEEYATGFYTIDPIFKFFFQAFGGMTVFQATFLLFQIMFWSLLVFSALLISGKRWQLWLLSILGIIFFFEIHHIIEAIFRWQYYPGMITATLFPVVGIFYWKELGREFAK